MIFALYFAGWLGTVWWLLRGPCIRWPDDEKKTVIWLMVVGWWLLLVAMALDAVVERLMRVAKWGLKM